VNTGLQWKNRFLQQPMKGVETGVCQNNDGGTRTQWYFKQKRCSLTSQKVCYDWKQDSLFNMINFQLEKVIRYAQMSVDCLMASKLVTLGYVCGIGLFSYLMYVHFWKNYAGRYIVDFVNKHHVIKAERAQTKSGNGTIGYRRKLPSVEITLPLSPCT